MATFDDFEFIRIEQMLQEVSPDEVLGCPSVLILKHVRQATIEFCRRTQWLRATLDSIRTVKNVTEYLIDDVPKDTKFSSIVWAELDGLKLAEREYEVSDAGNSIILDHVPDISGSLVIRAALEPVRTFDSFEKNLYERWADVISAGALGSLRRIPGKKWSDPQQAAFDSQEFENGITAAKIEVSKSRKIQTLNTARRSFAI